MNDRETKEWWTVSEIAANYGMSVRAVYDVIQAGKLVGHRFGKYRGGIRIADEDRLRWERQCRQAEPAPQPPHRRKPVAEPLVKKHFPGR